MGYPKSNGDVFSADEANSGVYNIIELYEGTDLDGTNTTTTHTLNLTASQISKYDYIDIQINGKFYARSHQSSSGGGTSGEITLGIENTIPDPDETILPTYIVCNAGTHGDNSGERTICNYFNVIYKLTSADKANGVALKFTVVGSGYNGTFTNRQIIIRGSLKY